MFTPRPYQEEALAALHTHICSKESNPCVVIPTGGGKSALIAWTIKRWTEDHPGVRVAVVAHRKELIEQNESELRRMMPNGDIGVFCASLKRREADADIVFASIDSVYKNAGEFVPFDIIMVDEAHRIPFSGEGKYRRFIGECKKFNRKLKVVGWTATPYRMSAGSICHRDHILNEVCYEANIVDLINDGYLCNLRTKIGKAQPDLGSAQKNSGGDYTNKFLSKTTSKVVTDAVREAVGIIKSENRRAAVFFCVDINHCEAVSHELASYGITAPAVTSKTDAKLRVRIADDFKNGKLRAICNVNVFTEGFNATIVDCIVLLRPTLSAGLFSQMVGRGMRVHAGKDNCLVLDFAGCIEEHGPVDTIDGGKVPLVTCADCRESFSRAIKECPECGWNVPKRVVEKLEAADAEKRMHAATASSRSILSNQEETLFVSDIFVTRYVKDGIKDSLLISYRCGERVFRERVYPGHSGEAGELASKWWRERLGDRCGCPSVDSAMEYMFFKQELLEWTSTVTVKKSGKSYTVIAYNQEKLQ